MYFKNGTKFPITKPAGSIFATGIFRLAIGVSLSGNMNKKGSLKQAAFVLVSGFWNGFPQNGKNPSSLKKF